MEGNAEEGGQKAYERRGGRKREREKGRGSRVAPPSPYVNVREPGGRDLPVFERVPV